MNKNGFTLVELLATIIIIGLIMVFVMPSAARVSRNNKKRIYSEYENMMVEYAKINENNSEDVINLYDLEELENVKNECLGYVTINHSTTPSTYHAYIDCGEEYKTTGYDSSLDSNYSGFCPGCVFPYITRNLSISYTGQLHTSLSTMYTSWTTTGNPPTKLNGANYTRRYQNLSIDTSVDGFIGVKLNSEGYIVRAYACAYINSTTPYCIEATSNGSAFNSNKSVLQSAYSGVSNVSCSSNSSSITCRDTSLGVDYMIVASASSTGEVRTGSNGENICTIYNNGSINCDDSDGISF